VPLTSSLADAGTGKSALGDGIPWRPGAAFFSMAASFAKVFAARRILVTGGAGFIGSNLARRRVRLGALVTLVDSMIPEDGGNLRNLAGIDRKLSLNISDVRDAHSLPDFVKGQHFLFNLAGQTSHMDSMADRQTDLEINAKAQLSILEACRELLRLPIHPGLDNADVDSICQHILSWNAGQG
jgi:NAD(P)-dependent dehydrogenase (short-subunit alcohol dehydrogenase family)